MAVVGKHQLNKIVHGKLDGTLPMIYEYNPDIILQGLGKMMGVENTSKNS